MIRQVATMLVCAAMAGCGAEMDDQPSYRDHRPAPLFRNGGVLQAPAGGTVARGDLASDTAATKRPPVTPALLAHGRERFDIFCAPCHGRTGEGDGMIVRRGMPRPPSLHDDRLRAAPDQHFFDVITGGYGAMYAYGARVPAADRWAIVAYIRALQLSQHASLDDLPSGERDRLAAEPPK
jgi:mono/diheme cytochrome c family protein